MINKCWRHKKFKKKTVSILKEKKNVRKKPKNAGQNLGHTSIWTEQKNFRWLQIIDENNRLWYDHLSHIDYTWYPKIKSIMSYGIYYYKVINVAIFITDTNISPPIWTYKQPIANFSHKYFAKFFFSFNTSKNHVNRENVLYLFLKQIKIANRQQ